MKKYLTVYNILYGRRQQSRTTKTANIKKDVDITSQHIAEMSLLRSNILEVIYVSHTQLPQSYCRPTFNLSGHDCKEDVYTPVHL